MKNNEKKELLSPDETPQQQMVLRDQLKYISSLRGTRKIDYLITAANASELVKNLSAEEIYLTIKEVGEEDSIQLFELTNFQQTQYLFDLEWWNRDELSPEKICQWFSIMLESSSEKFIEWARNVSTETLIAVFHKLVRVHSFDNVDDLHGDRPELYFFTLDSVFFIEFLYPAYDNIVIRALKIIRAAVRNRYYDLLSGVQWFLESEQEEQAFYWRQRRLEESGFPEIDDAMRIYAPLTDEIRHALQGGSPKPRFAEIHDEIYPAFPLQQQNSETFLMKVIDFSGNFTLENRVRFELVQLSHKILVADVLTPDFDTLSAVLRKAAAYVNIGLELLDLPDVQSAEKILETNYCEHLFRYAFEKIAHFRDRAQRIVSNLGEQEKEFYLSFIDVPHRDFLESLSGPRPLFLEYNAVTEKTKRREFEHKDDLEQTSFLLEETELLLKLFKDRLGFSFSTDEHLDSPLLRAMGREINWRQLFNSLFINGVTENRLDLQPVISQQLHHFYTIGNLGEVSEEEFLNSSHIEEFNNRLLDMNLVMSHELGALKRLEVDTLKKLFGQFHGIQDLEVLDDPRLFPELWMER